MPTLHWIGKERIVNHHAEVLFRVLEHQYGFRGDNPDDRTETHSGNKWADLAGNNYSYFMVFPNKEVEGAITTKELVAMIEEL